jgi:hypothetical protein
MKKCLFSVCLLFLLPSCASIIDGHSQVISINTQPPKADCILNRQGYAIGQIDSTPGSMTIEKTRDDISIACTKPGYINAEAINKSGVDGWVFGNIALGGLIGLGVDWGTGAINKYDSQTNIVLKQDEDAPVYNHHKHKKKDDDDDGQ